MRAINVKSLLIYCVSAGIILTSVKELEEGLYSYDSPITKSYREFRKRLRDESTTEYPQVECVTAEEIPLKEFKEYVENDSLWNNAYQSRMFRMYVLELYLHSVMERADLRNRSLLLSKALFDASDSVYDKRVATKYIKKVQSLDAVIDVLRESDEIKAISKVKCLHVLGNLYREDVFYNFSKSTELNKESLALMENSLNNPEKYKMHGDSLYGMGETEYYQQHYDKAIIWFQQAASSYRNANVSLFDESIDFSHGWVLHYRGFALYKLGRYAESIKDYETVIGIVESSKDPLFTKKARRNLIEDTKKWIGYVNNAAALRGLE